MTTSRLQATTDLARRGLLLFPIKAGAKAPPLVPGFPSWAQAVPFDRKLWPTANIGVHCKDLLVLDIDVAKGGFATLMNSEFANGELPATFTVETPSGGRHFYFSCPGGVRNGVNVLGPGVDVRSNNGYVLGPGSALSTGEYRIVNDAPFAPAPDWLVAACRKTAEKIEPFKTPTGNIDEDAAIKRAQEWLLHAPVAVQGEGGDHRTFATLCKLRDFGVPRWAAADTIDEWNSRCSPPWDADELERKISNAYSYAQNSPGIASVEAMFDVIEPAAAQPSGQPAAAPAQSELYGPDDVALADVLASDYLVKGWIDRAVQALLFGHWGAGKTFIALHLAAHLAAGKPWFGTRVKQGGVLYLGYEGGMAVRKRLYALRKHLPDFALKEFLVRSLRAPIVRRNAEGKTKGQEVVESALLDFRNRTGHYPALVVIDPLRNALGGSDSDPDLTAPFLSYLQNLTKQTGCSTLTIHHPGHGDAERSRGDSGIEAHMDTVIKVDGVSGTIETRKQRDDPRSTLYYRLKVVELGLDSDGDPRTTCVVEQVSENPLDPTLTTTQQNVLDKLQELVQDDGLVTKTLFKRASSDLDAAARGEVFDALLAKRYLVVEQANKSWRLGAGAAEMFS